MTSILRAATISADRVLRLAVVRDGRVVEERLVDRESITVGQSEACSVIVADPRAPERATIVERTRAGFVLTLPRGATATLAGADEPTTIEPGERVVLGEGARGKIAAWGATLLFQLIPRPPEATRPALPLALRDRPLDGHDWGTTFIAAFSFLLHFGLIGALYSDWADDVVDDDARVAQLVQELSTLPAPKVEIATTTQGVPSPSSEAATKTVPGDKTSKPPPSDRGANGGSQTPHDGGGTPGHIGDARAIALASELRAIDAQMVGVLNGGGPATDAVLGGGNVPTSMLEEAARSEAGSRRGGPAGLDLGVSPGIVRPGVHNNQLAIGDTTSRGPIDPIKIADVPKPKPLIVNVPPPASPDLPDAGAVIGRLQAGFRACFRKAISDDPTVKGSVRMTVRVGPNGEVTGVSAGAVSGLPGSLVACLSGKLGSASFSPPPGGGATVVVPMRFETQP